MGVFDFLKGIEYKREVEILKKKLDDLHEKEKSMEQMTILELEEEIFNQEKKLGEIKAEVVSCEIRANQTYSEIESSRRELEELKRQLVVVGEDLTMETFGLYTPKYNFASALVYKEKLQQIRAEQKQMIKDKTAVNFFEDWTIDGSKAKGKKFMNDNIKQILRSFNNECEAAINKVKYNNINLIENRIKKSFEQLNKLNQSQRLSLTTEFLNLKMEELYLSYEYEKKQQSEKEVLREQREREKEEKALQKEIQSKKKLIDKDIEHYKKLISELQRKLDAGIPHEEQASLENQIIDLGAKVEERHAEKEELDYRTAHASAGYVYIISNIGAFGKDILKIGVTRRIDPLERIGELSSASVPFKFDVHALIFSYEAYKLESDLHRFFDSYRLNKVNSRKEFFKVPIEKIEEKLLEYGDLTIDFRADVDAEEYRESLAAQ